MERAMPRTLIPTPDQPQPDLLVSLPALHHKLEEQRRFRLEQLAELAASDPAPASDGHLRLRTAPAVIDPARREVAAALASAARQALADIDAALARMNSGRYGTCLRCGTRIPLARLQTVPQAALCFDCHRTVKEG
jgi:RNA polymerase-binding transcription factor DksA